MNYENTLRYLYDHIPRTRGTLFPGEPGLKRMERLMRALGDPQDQLKIIHIAGTSGKSSTATMISKFLSALGYKVGLTVSPHLIDIRERVQINNRNISKKKFAEYFTQVKGAFDKFETADNCRITYFEAVIALAYYVFRKEKTDYAVIETGLGGTYDGTNVIHVPKVAVITRLGFDHEHILGRSLREIALHKAGIIGKNNRVIYQEQRPVQNDVIYERVQATSSLLYFPEADRGVVFPEHLPEYQKFNANLALTCIKVLLPEKYQSNKKILQSALEDFSFPGRFSCYNIKGNTVILDGAHNPQKMQALMNSLHKIYPSKKFNFLLGFKKIKKIPGMLSRIVPFAREIITTSFYSEKFDLVQYSEDPEKVKEMITDLNFKNVSAVGDLSTALSRSLENEHSAPVVITGSLYLLSAVYEIMHKLKFKLKPDNIKTSWMTKKQKTQQS
jgi:dihydrofolate synthase/folylpolyglutamate synthase